jgi:hypothetical protein
VQALTDCQNIYHCLLLKAADLIAGRKKDGLASGFSFQDSVNHLYHTCFDGTKITKLEGLHSCILADMTLDELNNLIRNNLFDDILTLLDAARVVYAESGDETRLSKIAQLKEVMSLLGDFLAKIEAKEYDSAVANLRTTRVLLQNMKTLPPRTIRVPALKVSASSDPLLTPAVHRG